MRSHDTLHWFFVPSWQMFDCVYLFLYQKNIADERNINYQA